MFEFAVLALQTQLPHNSLIPASTQQGETPGCDSVTAVRKREGALTAMEMGSWRLEASETLKPMNPEDRMWHHAGIQTRLPVQVALNNVQQKKEGLVEPPFESAACALAALMVWQETSRHTNPRNTSATHIQQ